MAEQTSATTARAAARVVSLTPRRLEWLRDVEAAGFTPAEARRLLFVCWLMYTRRMES